MQSQKPLRLGTWARVSAMGDRRESDESFRSTSFQAEDCFNWANRNNAQIVSIWNELNISGAKPKRRHLDEIITALENDEIDGVIVAYLSRFARSFRVALGFLDRFWAAGGVLICAQEDLIVSEDAKPDIWDRFNMGMTMSESEWRRKRAELIRAQQNAITNGIAIRTCFGYQRGPGKRLVPDPVQAPWVVRMFEMRAEGHGYRGIARALNDEGAPPPSKRGMYWEARTVWFVIKRRTYLGEVCHDKGRTNVVKNAHPALVDDLLFTRANQVVGVRPERNGRNLLSGLLRCSGCRSKLKSKKSGKRIYYGCPGRSSGHICTEPTSISELKLAPVLRAEAVRVWNMKGKEFQTVNDRPAIRALREESDILERRYKLHARDIEMREDDANLWREIRDEYKQAWESKKQDLSTALKAEMKSAPAERTEAQFPADREGQRAMLLAAFECVFLRRDGETIRDRVYFIPKGAAMPDVPVPGNVFDSRPFTWDDNRPVTAVPVAE